MIGENNPEINVDELMAKIRDEVAKRKGRPQRIIKSSHADTSNLTLHLSYIESFLKNAEDRAYTRTKWPDKLNRFPFNLSKKLQKATLKLLNFLFKDQREINFNLLQALRESVVINQQLVAEISSLKTQLNENLQTVDTQLQANHERLQTVDTQLQANHERLQTVDTQLQATHDHLQTVDTQLQANHEHYIRNDSYVKNDLMQQQRLIGLFLEEARRRLPAPFDQEQLQTFVNEDEHLLDAFYVAFEDYFRGSREDILNRLKVYLPLIEQANIGTPDAPILDIGCGRGEWLELLRDSGYISKGIDINRVMIEQCQARALDVMAADVIDYLQTLPENSLGAITGFHIIEHLPFKILMRLFAETVRVLKPQGLVIFETPNPENILVGSNNFYLDPTHHHPLPSATIQFIAEISGLCNIQVMKLHPYPENQQVAGEDLAQRFNHYFYGCQDYAIIGYKHE
jgi:2-polyprenyl-3-methyl-5-hydroxy-6-metoxy-1,4-benzoquinol methylase